MKSFKTIVPFLKANKGNYIFGIIMLIMVDAVNLMIPQLFRIFSDLVVGGDLTRDSLVQLIFYFSAAGLFMAFGRFVWRNALFGTSRRLEYWLRDKLMKKYLEMDSNYFNHHRTGDLMAHATNDVQNVRMSMGGGIMMVTDSLFMTVFTVIMMIWTVGVKSAFIALISLPFLTMAVILISKPIRNRNTEVQNSFSDLTTEVQENLSGIRVIKAFATEKNRGESFAEANDDYRRKNIRLARLDGLFNPLIMLISGVSFVVFIYYGSMEIIAQRMTLGDFVAIINYLYMIVWPLVAMGMVTNNFQRGISSMNRLNEIFASKPVVQEATYTENLPLAQGKVEFKNVSFRYGKDEPWVLENVSFVVEPGDNLAILGKTGIGKSTIIHLLLRRYDIQEGEILLDDINIKTLSFEDLYRAIAVVPQENFLFSRNINRNIAFSSENVDEEKVIEAAKFSQVDLDIKDMPEQYDTIVGERGVTLSGGQKQRVAIARAYYKDAPILVLDDSLSAVDTETESRILDKLDEVKKTVVMVSQRISTVQHAKQIIVLEDGKVSQRGNHSELMATDGFYSDLYQRQLLEVELDQKDKAFKEGWEV